MLDVKDLAQAAQGAAVAPENVNVVEQDAKTEQVQTLEAIVNSICSKYA